MNLGKTVLSPEEKIRLQLREIYASFGYTRFRMSKFEEYDLYAENKDFLVSDRVIAFTDTNGRLMALKPDVTLSIVRSGRDGAGVQKVWYTENVYRVGGSGSFREIPQIGLECVGEVDGYCLAEVLLLAAKSLAAISPKSVLQVSHLDVLSRAIDALGIPEHARHELVGCAAEKNLPAVEALCRREGANGEATKTLLALLRLNGSAEEVLPALRELGFDGPETAVLENARQLLELYSLADKLQLDFSAVSDMRYYNGITFRGYVDGIPTRVLSGGQYDRLLRRMGRHAAAVGFAIYQDLLERFFEEHRPYDADVLLLYDENTDPLTLAREVKTLTESGLSVSAQTKVPEGLRYGGVRRVGEGARA